MHKDGSQEPMHEEGSHEPGLVSCAEELISAVHMKNAERVCSALKSAFQILDSEPHEEGSEE